ncbi:unnamed protein product [Arabis nemorensis]|uniref:Arabidopsis retrotransposon Orf1 C-terminal domain-containing protein n=1 Tax=Arabis nemorensis TaxID=586526 RepID=A0A565BAB6_9BRAS|nr:unnamed protein product [Arabis nemorensis]
MVRQRRENTNDESEKEQSRAITSTKKNDDGASSSNKKGKSKKVVPKVKVTVPPYTTYLKALQKCDMVPTKYVDKELLGQLGILDDVEAIMNNMGFDYILHKGISILQESHSPIPCIHSGDGQLPNSET